jgi:hypothetical protein
VWDSVQCRDPARRDPADVTADALIASTLPDGLAIPRLETTQVRRPPVPSEAELKANAAAARRAWKIHRPRGFCTKCHGTAVFARIGMGRLGWADEVAAIVERGAIGTDLEIRTSIEYMVKNFGKWTV